MKKIILLLGLLVLATGYSQTLLQGFESGGINGGPFGGMPIPVIEAGTGSNTSQVLKIVTNTGGEPWQGINLNLSPSTNLTVNKTLTIDVLSDEEITFLVKVTTGGAIAAAPVTHNGDGTWQTLSFTFNTSLDGQAENPSGTYSGFVIHAYWEVGRTQFFTPTVTPRPARTFYVDNIREPAPLVEDVIGDVYINDGTFVAGDFTTAAGQDIATNDGSAAEPFATLDYALARSIQGPGDVIYIDAGTYSWATTHALTDSGTTANPITIQGKGNNETNITTTAVSTTSAGLHFTTGEHWVVKDLNWTATAARAVRVDGVAGITLDNCIINMNSGGLQSIFIGTAGGELTIKNSTLTRSNTGFHMVEVVEGTTLIMQDNTVRFNALGGGGTASGVQLRTNASSVFIIERNKFSGGGYGIGNVVGTVGPVDANSIIKNNFFTSFWGIVTTIVQGLTVHNNSFYTNGESIYGINAGSLTNWDIRNNILYTYGTTRACVMSGSTTSHPAIMDYNHYYSPITGAARQGSTSGPILSFTAWQNAAGGPWETNGQGGNAASFDPLYVDAANGDLHLQPGSPAIGAGVDVGITDDIDGDARPLSGTFDMGADEFAVVVSSDATLSDLQVDGVSISGFNPVTTDYTLEVSCSVSSIPQITSATSTSPLASVVITQAPDVFEDATVVVTAEDGITTETYTVRIALVRPDIIQDFENTATYTGLTGDNGTAATIESSPGGITGNSLQLVSTSGAGTETFQAGFFDQVSDFVVLTSENSTVQVDVYSTQAFNLRLKLEVGAGPIERTEQYTTPNAWQTLTYDFGAVTATYERIVFFLNSNATNDGFLASQDFTAFVDNIRLSSVQTEQVTYTYDNGGWLPSDPAGNYGCKDILNIVAGDLIMTTDTEVDTITIAPGASLTVDPGVTLTAGSVNLNSTSSTFSSLIVEGTVNGTVSYSRYTTVLGTNDLIASPVSGQDFGPFAEANPNLAASGTLRAFAPYNTSDGEYQNYDTALNAGTTIGSGIGFRAATTGGSNLIFSGTLLETEPFDVSISSAGLGNAWNLIGNPYPSYLDFAEFFNTDNKLELNPGGAFQAIYGYNGTAWTVWNQATIDDNSETELIAPGQAFFVKSVDGGGSVRFTKSMAVIGSSDDFIAGRNSNNLNVAASKLILSTAEHSTYTRIYFIEGNTRGLDQGYDAGAYDNASGNFSIFTNLVENNQGLDMAIQTLGYEDFSDVVIPVGVKASAGIALTIGLGANTSLPATTNVYLEDTQENTFTLLNTTDYTFTPENDLVGTGRFFLRYSSSVLSVNPNDGLNEFIIYADNVTKDIIIKGVLTDDTTTDLYDIQGRLVLSEKLEQSISLHSINVSSMSAGIYIIKVSNTNGTKTQKLIIK